MSISGCRCRCCCFPFLQNLFYSVNNINFVEKFALYNPLNVEKKWQAWPVAVLLTFSTASHFCGGVLLCWCQKAVISTTTQNCGFKTENNRCRFSSMIFFSWELSRACRLLLKLHQKQRSQRCTITSSLEKSQHVGHLFFTLCVVIFSFSSLFVFSFYQFAFLHFVFLWIRVSAAPELFFLFNTIQKLIKFCTCRVEK